MEIIHPFHRIINEGQTNEEIDYQYNSKSPFGSPLTRSRGTLDLSDSPEKIKDLPNSISSMLHDLQWLQTLDLSGNKLQNFDEDFILSLSKIPNLTALDLSFNSLSELPSFFTVLFSITSLDTLNLGSNQFDSFPDILLPWKNVRRLDLHGNNLSHIPQFEEGHLENVEELNLNYNKISSLNPSLKCLKKLQTLQLCSNRLSEVPAYLSKLENLQYLNVENNSDIVEVPSVLVKKIGTIKTSLPQQIIPGFFIGDIETATNELAVKKHGITHILSACGKVPEINKKFFVHLELDVDDNPSQDLYSYFHKSNEFIRKGMEKGGVLVHCLAGVSRSATLAIAFLMFHENLTVDEAWEKVKKARSVINPNLGFVSQLQRYELSLRKFKEPKENRKKSREHLLFSSEEFY